MELTRLPEDIRDFGYMEEANLTAVHIRRNKLTA